jgi:hypothetical protein
MTSHYLATSRHAKLVSYLFKGSTLARAWALSGYSKRHHANLAKILSIAEVRDDIASRIAHGEKLRGKLHDKAVAILTSEIPKSPDCHSLDELL